MRHVHNIAFSVAALSACFITYPALAQTNPLTGTVNSQLILTSGCAIDTGNGSVNNGGVFGALDFGSQPGTFTGSLSAQATGTGAAFTQITCTPDVSSLNVTVNGGQHVGQGSAIGAGTRAVANGTDYVPYEVYSDAAHSSPYVDGTPQVVAVGVAGASFDLPIYGVANKTDAAALSAGLYTDTLNVTIGW